MNMFRRLFSQPEPESNPADEQPPTPANDEVETAESVEMSNDIVETPVATPLPSVLDGATRPLPQEPVMPTNGNEHISFGQATDVGMVRTNNQDAALSFFTTARSVDEQPDFGLFIVADGMGGHHDGEKASAITTRTLARHLINDIYLPMIAPADDEADSMEPISEILVEAVQKANQDVVKHVPQGGTTLTAVAIVGDLAYVAHVGDSRVYLIYQQTIEKITRDHSLVQRLKELGQITDDEMIDHPQKNVLYRALGQGDLLEVDTLTRRLPPNSKLLLCSDGLWNQVEDREILDVILKHSNPQETCEKLVELANARGGLDNVTAVLLHIPG